MTLKSPKPQKSYPTRTDFTLTYLPDLSTSTRLGSCFIFTLTCKRKRIICNEKGDDDFIGRKRSSVLVSEKDIHLHNVQKNTMYM